MPRVSPFLFVPLVAALGAVASFVVLARIPLRYNIRNLLVRWRTTALTGLAFTLVTALLTVMMSFVNGMYQLTENSGQPRNVIILSEGVTEETFSNLAFSDASDIRNQPGIARDGGQPLCSGETYVVVNQPMANAVAGRPARRFLQLRGVEDPERARRVHNIRLHPGGRWFSQAGVEEISAGAGGGPPAIQAVLGEGIARVLAADRSSQEREAARVGDRLKAGDTFTLADRRWLVVGVMQSSGSTFDSEIWAKRSILGPLFGKENYTSFVIQAEDEAAAIRLKQFFNTQYRKGAVQALLEKEYFASLSQTNRQFLVAVIFVSAVMGVGGIFGVMNTMFAAVSQRTRDIGVLRLLGYARWQILASFLLESLLIALAGGLIGCAIGSLADGWTASSIVGAGHGGGSKFVVLRLAVDADTRALGCLLALAMGAAGGLLPALSAVRLRPLDALR